MRSTHHWKVPVIGIALALMLLGSAVPIAVAEEQSCAGTLGAITVDNLRVPPNATCRLTRTRVQGNITVENNATLYASNVAVTGNVQAQNAARVELLPGSVVGGSIQIVQSGAALVAAVQIDGDLFFDANVRSLAAIGNRIGGNLQAFQNTGGLTIIYNTIDGNLQCKANTPAPIGGANAVKGNKEDQCANLPPVVSLPVIGGPRDTTPPNTTLTSQPANPTTSASATFSFSGSDDMTPPSALRFECRLDSLSATDFVACVSPRSYAGLSIGTHTFAVRAIDQAGNVDPTPARWTWTIAPAPGCGAPIAVFADADSWIDQNSASNNFGTDAILKVRSQGPSDNFRALVRFALPSSMPAGCVVQSATLRLYAASATSGRTLQAVRIATPWSENLVTWSNQPTTTGAIATITSSLGYREWQVAAQVQAMYAAGANHGFLIRDAVEGAGGAEQQLHSREKGENPPMLVIAFAATGPQAGMAVRHLLGDAV